MAWVAAVAAGAASAYKAYQEAKSMEEQAVKTREQGNRVMAATTREMAEEDRTKDLMESRAIAVAAASGGGVDNPTVSNIIGDLNAEGEYRIMSILWRGSTEKAGLSYAANQLEKAADQRRIAGIFETVTSAMTAYAGAGGSFGSTAAPGAAAGGGSGAYTPSAARVFGSSYGKAPKDWAGLGI